MLRIDLVPSRPRRGNPLRELEPSEPVRRYEREHPGSLIHIDIKKLGNFNRVVTMARGQQRRPPMKLSRTAGLAVAVSQSLALWRPSLRSAERPGGDDYIRHLALPEFFFHISIAHAILRHLGAKIGKRDYPGKLAQQSGGDYSGETRVVRGTSRGLQDGKASLRDAHSERVARDHRRAAKRR